MLGSFLTHDLIYTPLSPQQHPPFPELPKSTLYIMTWSHLVVMDWLAMAVVLGEDNAVNCQLVWNELVRGSMLPTQRPAMLVSLHDTNMKPMSRRWGSGGFTETLKRTKLDSFRENDNPFSKKCTKIDLAKLDRQWVEVHLFGQGKQKSFGSRIKWRGEQNAYE